jgi:hypothetical protein
MKLFFHCILLNIKKLGKTFHISVVRLIEIYFHFMYDFFFVISVLRKRATFPIMYNIRLYRDERKENCIAVTFLIKDYVVHFTNSVEFCNHELAAVRFWHRLPRMKKI